MNDRKGCLVLACKNISFYCISSFVYRYLSFFHFTHAHSSLDLQIMIFSPHISSMCFKLRRLGWFQCCFSCNDELLPVCMQCALIIIRRMALRRDWSSWLCSKFREASAKVTPQTSLQHNKMFYCQLTHWLKNACTITWEIFNRHRKMRAIFFPPVCTFYVKSWRQLHLFQVLLLNVLTVQLYSFQLLIKNNPLLSIF